MLVGDFGQTLPVIPRGIWVDELKASVKFSYLWRNVKKALSLHLYESTPIGRSVFKSICD